VAEQVERFALGGVAQEEVPSRQIEVGERMVERRVLDVLSRLVHRVVGRLKAVLRDEGRREGGVGGRRVEAAAPVVHLASIDCESLPVDTPRVS
jgi:hypothetical protein